MSGTVTTAARGGIYRLPHPEWYNILPCPVGSSPYACHFYEFTLRGQPMPSVIRLSRDKLAHTHPTDPLIVYRAQKISYTTVYWSCVVSQDERRRPTRSDSASVLAVRLQRPSIIAHLSSLSHVHSLFDTLIVSERASMKSTKVHILTKWNINSESLAQLKAALNEMQNQCKSDSSLCHVHTSMLPACRATTPGRIHHWQSFLIFSM
ncbi:hypothetical protein K474DRAFT_268090 [Panus rudis PR-1116 ss-1]|nr:hypothetical protein K474DRAFT_268090 [Panus rudis PR-1116 ss-1]